MGRAGLVRDALVLSGLLAVAPACAPGGEGAGEGGFRPLPLRAYCAVRDFVRSQDYRVRDARDRDLCAEPLLPRIGGDGGAEDSQGAPEAPPGDGRE